MPEDFDFSQFDDLGSNLTPAEKRKLRRMDSAQNAPKQFKDIKSVEEWEDTPSAERLRMAMDELANMASRWDGDSQDENAYRSLIASANVLLNVILKVEPSECSEPIIMAMTTVYTSVMTEIKRLDALRAFYPQTFKID